MRIERLGELRARIVGGADGRGGGDGPAVVLLHGFGAPPDDLVDLATLLRVRPELRFVFPEAPLSLDEGFGRAWWMLDVSLFERRARGEVVDRSEEVPEALSGLRAQLGELLERLEERLAITPERTILGGFSQGAMLACDVALQLERGVRGLALLSGTLLARSLWQPRVERLAGVPVFMSHGQLDPILPHADAERLCALLRGGGAAVEFVSFRGGHDLPPIVLDALGRFLDDHTL